MVKDFTNSFSINPASRGKQYLILFILWPFLAMLIALANFNQKEARRVFYLFLIYYGLTIVIGTEGIDSFGYALKLKANSLRPFSDFFDIVGGIYAEDTSMDIVEPLISFIISRFTDNYRALFAAYAALFGFFYVRSIKLLYDRYQETRGLDSLIHLIFFSFVIPITYINGFRMWTAAWIFFYGAYHVILYRDIKFLIISLSASLVHFSFLSANIILIIYYFAGNRNMVYFPLVIASFVLPQLFFSTFQAISLRLGGGLQSRFESYSDEGYVIFRQEDVEQAAWFLKIGDSFVLYYLVFSIFIIQIVTRKMEKENTEKNLYSFSLLFLAFVNFGKSIPSFGGRFQIIFFLFATLYLFRHYCNVARKKINYSTLIGMLPMLLYTVVALRQGSETINAWLFSPILGLPLAVPGVTLYKLLF